MESIPCKQNPELFFDEELEDVAVSLCGGCPFKTQCLGKALAYESQHLEEKVWGVWGGKTPAERDAIRRK